MIHEDTLGVYHTQVLILFVVVAALSLYMPREMLPAFCAITVLFMASVGIFAGVNRSKRTTRLLLLFNLSSAIALGTVPIFAYRMGGVIAAIATIVVLTGVRLGIGYAYWRPLKK